MEDRGWLVLTHLAGEVKQEVLGYSLQEGLQLLHVQGAGSLGNINKSAN